MDFPGGTLVKNPSANAGETRDAGSTPGLGRSPELHMTDCVGTCARAHTHTHTHELERMQLQAIF